jgi:aryl-alcohol dehydrogenase-like predicted oxidoreductase
VRPQVEGSLARLQLSHTDAFVFHNVRTAADWEHVRTHGLDEVQASIDAGLTRFRGISSHHPDVLRAALDDGRCDLLMFPVGPFVDARYVEEILPRAKAHGVGTVCFKTFGAGKLLGDTSGYNQPLAQRPRGKLSSGGSDDGEATLPRISVAECLHYTLTLDPDVALLGLSFPNEQDAAFAAARAFRPLTADELASVRARAAAAVADKGEIWWNPPAGPPA